MIVEERIYTLLPGKTAEYFRAYATEGMAIQVAHLGPMLGYYSTESGPLNTLVHLWGYENAADREARRARMLADPAWQVYIKKVQPLVVTQESRILNPAPFFAPRLAAIMATMTATTAATMTAGGSGEHPAPGSATPG
ncbi:MAG TPA: NIPSNAP family protein [Polyangia bacterium]|nr:NIPSNAP family protein [Polyangia bacterium]